MLWFWLLLSSYENGTLPPGNKFGAVCVTNFVCNLISPFCLAAILKKHANSLQSCPTLSDPMDYSPPGSSVHRQECWSGRLLLPPGDLPDPGIKPTSLMSPALAGRSFTTSTAGKAQIILVNSAGEAECLCAGHRDNLLGRSVVSNSRQPRGL